MRKASYTVGLLFVLALSGSAIADDAGTTGYTGSGTAARDVRHDRNGTITVNLDIDLKSKLDQSILCFAEVSRYSFAQNRYVSNAMGHYALMKRVTANRGRCTVVFKYTWGDDPVESTFRVNYGLSSPADTPAYEKINFGEFTTVGPIDNGETRTFSFKVTY